MDRLKHFPFVDVAGEVSLTHEYRNGAQGQLLMVESLGGGGGWLDYDQDGLLDVYLAQGGDPTGGSRTERPQNSLFRQLTSGQFEEVTNAAGVGDRGYGQGMSIADFDSDGFDDIYVTNVGRNTLYRNMGDGTFTEITEAAGVGDSRWSSSAAWADLDQDGDLDLYVCNYLKYDPDHPVDCIKDGKPALCHPGQIEAWPDEYYENLGNGRFRARAQSLGLSGPGNKALGVVIADLNNDHHPDVYVCNDTTANFLFLNRGDGTFQESAIRLGAALSNEGAAQASMGVACGDYDRNGFLDLYLTHFTDESNTLYRNLGAVGFDDVSPFVGLREPTLMKLGFGAVMHDFNQDGHPDLFTANGHIDERNADGEGFEQTPQLLTYMGSIWSDVSRHAGPFFERRQVGRAVASADYDRDGDLDLLVVHQNTPTALLRNDSSSGHWIKFRLVGRESNRSAINARVTVHRGDEVLLEELAGGTSYCASHEKTLCFGLGAFSEPCRVEILWPSGRKQTFEAAVDAEYSVIEGQPPLRATPSAP